MMGWRVVTLKYGKLLEAAFARPDGEQLRAWIDDCPNSLYSALVYKGGAGWREHLPRDLNRYPGIRAHPRRSTTTTRCTALMTNLAGHDMEAVLEAFQGVGDDRPTCFIAYTIKGYGPALRRPQGQPRRPDEPGADGRLQGRHGRSPTAPEWDHFAGLDVPAGRAARRSSPRRAVRAEGAPPHRGAGDRRCRPRCPGRRQGSRPQEGFGRILDDLAGEDSELAARIVTTSPDVTVSTNLGAWVNRRGIFDRTEREDMFREREGRLGAALGAWRRAASTSSSASPRTTCSCCWRALGLRHALFGARLLPIGTLYDPFIKRGLDALNYACYQDARFMVVATPSGLTLAPEGGAHQSHPHAADRHRPARPACPSSRPMSTSWPC